MATIVYGIAGEGWGHAVHSRAIIDELSKHHDVIILGGRKAYAYFKKRHARRIASLVIHYRKGGVSKLGTAAVNITRSPLYAASLIKVMGIMMREKPDVVVSDFEPFTAYAAMILKIPLVHVSNQYLRTHSTLRTPSRFKEGRWSANAMNRIIGPRGHNYVITSFTDEKPVPGACIIPPPLRAEIARLKPKDGKHLLAYQTSKSDKRLHGILAKAGVPCVVYGFGAKPSRDNVNYKEFNEQTFYQDLADAKAVITNGGHNLMVEALYLHKPVLSIPVRKQYEQVCNAVCLQRMGYGMMTAKLTEKNVQEFVKALPRYKAALRKMKWRDDGAVLAATMIERYIRTKQR